LLETDVQLLLNLRIWMIGEQVETIFAKFGLNYERLTPFAHILFALTSLAEAQRIARVGNWELDLRENVLIFTKLNIVAIIIYLVSEDLIDMGSVS